MFYYKLHTFWKYTFHFIDTQKFLAKKTDADILSHEGRKEGGKDAEREEWEGGREEGREEGHIKTEILSTFVEGTDLVLLLANFLFLADR